MRKWRSIISTLSLLLAVLVISGIWQFNRTLNNLHIEQLNYHVQTFNLHEVKFSQLSFIYHAEKKQTLIVLKNFHMQWQWKKWFSPHVSTITIEQAQLDESAKTYTLPPKNITQAPFTLPTTWSIPAIFPKQIHIQTLKVTLLCPTGTCPLAGSFNAFTIKTGLSVKGVNLHLNFSPGETLHPEHQLRLNALYTFPQNLPKLEVKLLLDHSLELQFTTHLEQKNEIFWRGTLNGYATYPNDWWQPYLAQWNIRHGQNIQEKNSDQENVNPPNISLKSEWQLAVTPLLNINSNASTAEWIKALTGNLTIDAKIPAPITLIDIGAFGGQVKLELDITEGQLNHYALVSEVNADHLAFPKDWQAIGLQADKLKINVNSKMDVAANLVALPVTFSGSTEGSLHIDVAGNLLVDAVAKKILLEKFVVKAKAKQLKPLAGMQLNNTTLDLHATGEWHADGTAIWPQLTFNSEASLTIGKLIHPHINSSHTKPWHWQGKTQGSLESFDVTGELGVGTSLTVKHQVKREAAALNVDWQISDIFLLAANPFADTLKAWPPLLTLARGKINAVGNLTFNLATDNAMANSLKKSNLDIQILDVAGIYDTIAFQGMSSNINITTLDKTLRIATNEIKVDQVDKGFVAGPLLAAGHYHARWDKPTQGKLTLKQFTGKAMDGNISTAAQEFDFSRKTQAFMVEVKNINLATLLLQYPSSELSGNGQLSGSVPVEIDSTGIRITKGMVSAEAPGGQLKYKSQRAIALAKTQPGMKLITEALDDFHYSMLATQVNYDANGKLLLSVRLEGKNPALENGRPIHFNVNLEEDIPAMLASIQLSSKVTDIVKKRLHERLQKKNSTNAKP